LVGFVDVQFASSIGNLCLHMANKLYDEVVLADTNYMINTELELSLETVP